MDDMRTGEGLERRQVVMLAALVVVLLALVFFVFLRGGDAPQEEPSSAAGPAPLAQADSSEDPFDPGPADAASQPVETFEVFASRDPFEPVVENGAEGAGVSDVKDNQGSSEDPNGQAADPTGDDPGATNPNGDNADTGPNPQAGDEEIEGHTVHLIDVFRDGGKDKAKVQVDSTGYTVGEGDVFAENFQLVSASEECATLLYGDDQFTLCEGEEILK